MVERGYVDRRSKNPAPSMSALAQELDLHTSTVSAVIRKKRDASPETVNLLVDALGSDIAEWLDVPYFGPWEPPAAATALTRRQRDALSELIVAITERKEVVGNVEGDPAPTRKDDLSGRRERRVAQPVKKAARKGTRKSTD